MTDHRAGLALALALALATPAAAETGTEMLFAEGQIVDLTLGRTLSYAHERRSPGEAGEAGVWRLALEEKDGERRALLSLNDGERTRRLDPFPAGPRAGNPVLMAFFESVTRRIAEETGGNPHYIRNRIKDALRTGGAVAPAPDGQAITYRPFTDDPNADALGAFTGLSLVMTVAEGAPGNILSLVAETDGSPPAYRESVRLERGDTAEGENE